MKTKFLPLLITSIFSLNLPSSYASQDSRQWCWTELAEWIENYGINAPEQDPGYTLRSVYFDEHPEIERFTKDSPANDLGCLFAAYPGDELVPSSGAGKSHIHSGRYLMQKSINPADTKLQLTYFEGESFLEEYYECSCEDETFFYAIIWNYTPKK